MFAYPPDCTRVNQLQSLIFIYSKYYFPYLRFVSKLRPSIEILKNLCKVFLRHATGQIFLLQAQSLTAYNVHRRVL
jgi:hypothetical protein